MTAEARAITVADLFDRAARSPWALCAGRHLRALTSGPCAACGRSVQAHALAESRACAAWLARPIGPAPAAWESCISATPARLPARASRAMDAGASEDHIRADIENHGR